VDDSRPPRDDAALAKDVGQEPADAAWDVVEPVLRFAQSNQAEESERAPDKEDERAHEQEREEQGPRGG